MKKKVIIGAIIAVVVLTLVIVSIVRNTDSAVAFGDRGGLGVNVQKISRGGIISYISADGFIQEKEKAQVYFDRSLRVLDVYVEENQEVSRGQEILQLDFSPLDSELEQLRINRNIQKITLEMAKSGGEIKNLSNAVRNAQKALEEANEIYNEKKSLYDSKAISKNELENAGKGVEDASFALRDATDRQNTAVENQGMDIGIKEQNLISTDLRIKELEDTIKQFKEYARSPMKGVISRINIEKGAYVGAMQLAYEILNTEELMITAYVNEYDSKNVAAGQEVSIWGDAIPQNIEITGTIESISPRAELRRTTGGEEIVVETVISIDSSYSFLRPGLSVTCDISAQSKDDIIVAPLEIIRNDRDGNNYVFIVDGEKNTMVKKNVSLGIISDMTAEVLEGLNEGDLAVSDPQPTYRDGMKVNIIDKEEK